MKKIKIWFSGMSGNFNPDNNFIINILKKYYEVELSEKPDYLFYSVNSMDYLKYNCIRIFYTAENLTPDFNICDYAIGFHYLDFDDRYIRFPLYLVDDFTVYSNDNYANDLFRTVHKHERAARAMKEKTDFCSFVYSNAKAAGCRQLIFEELSKYKPVHSGGKYLNNLSGPVDNKLEFQLTHKFVIAFENTSAPGYTTEKIIGASEENIVFHNFSSLHECDIEKTVVNEQSKALIRRELGLFESKKTVLSIGQFIPRKGFDILLDVWGQFDYSYQLVIIGGGAEQEKYKEIIRGRKYKNVHLLGYKSRNIISKYYQASDVFVLPTREDIWGLVINEAMAHGLPVISTANCIAACELIQNKINGYVIPGDDPEALSSALTNIWQENLKEIGTNNINKIKTYTIENVINQHLSVFQSDFDF